LSIDGDETGVTELLRHGSSQNKAAGFEEKIETHVIEELLIADRFLISADEGNVFHVMRTR
jgi:hypothetical protein